MDLRTLADRLGFELRGENRTIQGVANPEEAGPDDLIFLVESEYLPRIQASAALAFVGKGADRLEGKSQLVAENPRWAMARILAFFAHPSPRGIHPASVIDPSATLGEGVSVGAHAFVGPGCTIGRGTVLHPNVTVLDGVSIGEDCILYPGVTIREGCRLGDRVILQPGCVLGSDGYGFLFHEGKHEKIPQIGNV
ncbi:MAG: LpxD N-terminal domain-containing protein, partial [Bacteroidota bacterium]